MKTLEEKIAVMQAAAEGKEIEMETVYGWRYNSNPKWDWVKFDYRVKPEPEPKRYRPYTFEEANRNLKAQEYTHWRLIEIQ